MTARRKPPLNTVLTAARRRMLSPSGSGRPMSRQELAEALNAYLWQRHGLQEHLDENDIGKYERGEHRWPGVRRREAFRSVLQAGTDAELGFYINRRPRPGDDDHVAALLSSGAEGDAWDRLPSKAQRSGSWPHDRPEEPGSEDEAMQRRSLLAAGGLAVADLVLAAPLRVVQALKVTAPSSIVADNLDVAADSLDALVCHYAQAVPTLSPASVYDDLLGVRAYAGSVLDRAARSAGKHADVVVAAGWLSNLLAVVTSDLGDHGAMLVWCTDAERRSREAGHPELAAWAALTRATTAYYHGRAHRSVALAGWGQHVAPAGTVAHAKLVAQEMRARAMLGDADGMAQAKRRATAAMAALPTSVAPTGVFSFPVAEDPPYTATSLLLAGRFREAVAATSRVIETAHRPEGDDHGRQPSASSHARALLVLGLAHARLGRVDEAAAAGVAALEGAPLVWPTLVLARQLDQVFIHDFANSGQTSEYHARYREVTSRDPRPGTAPQVQG